MYILHKLYSEQKLQQVSSVAFVAWAVNNGPNSTEFNISHSIQIKL